MFINEAFNSSVGTQRSDLGKFKLFCLDITTLTVPNLVVNDLFLVKPMASFTGFLTYLKFAFSVGKGGVQAGQIYMNESPFTYAPMSEERANYTSDRIVETAEAGADYVPVWNQIDTKVKPFETLEGDNKVYYNAKIVKTVTDTTTGAVTITESFANFAGDGTSANPYKIAASNFPAAETGTTVYFKVAYLYDNIVIPQEKLPQIKAEMDSLTLEARARRIAVTYSQIAAFQA